MDTGSTTLAAAGKDCVDCQGVTPTYAVGAGGDDLGAAVESLYGTGNGWDGKTVDDTVQVGTGTSPVRMRFARVTRQIATSGGRTFFSGDDCAGNLIQNAAQGILGMGGIVNALPGTDAYMDTLANAGVDDAFSFEACDTGGRMWLGGYDPSAITAAPVYTPLDTSTGHDVITLSSITLGDNQLGLTAQSFGQVIVDTGTSIFLLPPNAFDTLVSGIESDPGYAAVLPPGFLASSGITTFPGTRDGLDAMLPAMHLVLPGANGQSSITVDLPATSSYLLPVTYQGHAGYTSAIAPFSSAQAITLLGASTMRSHVLIFDRGNKRLGYAQHGDCP